MSVLLNNIRFTFTAVLAEKLNSVGKMASGNPALLESIV